MRKSLIALLFFLIIVTDAFAGIYIYEPKDQLITLDKIITLAGIGKNLKILKINNFPFDFDEEGSFFSGLVLNRGKNYIELRAQDAAEDHFVEKIRILHFKTYPDMEELYEGKKHWARNQVVYLSTLGYIEGYPDDNFYPANPVTRGELASWVAREKKLKIPELTADVFFDVPKEHWRAPFVKAAVDAGYMTGDSNDTFGIDDPISRRQAAAMALRIEGIEVAEKIKPLFVDVPKEEKGAAPIYTAREKGLVVGIYEDIPVFDPDRALTRAEAAVLLSRFSGSLAGINSLFDYEKGYSEATFCKLNVAPQIVSFSADPKSIRAEQKNVVRLRVEVASRIGFFPISKVKVDLSGIGGMPDTEMFDDATHGDKQKGDLIYSLNISLKPEETGEKILSTTVIDRLGWESKKQTPLLILE